MRIFIFLFFVASLYGGVNDFKYYKDINFTDTKTKLIKLKLDKELFQHSNTNFKDIRLYEGTKEQGFMIKREDFIVQNKMHLYPSSYDRDSAKIDFVLDKPFDIKEIVLNISDRNFETTFDLYINDKLISSANQIYDYSKETGNRKFVIKADVQQAQKITLSYNLKNIRFFYKKYRDVEKSTQYLTLKSITLKNNNRAKRNYDFFYISPLNIFTKDRVSTYIFDTQNLKIDTLDILSKSDNYQRISDIYKSQDGLLWDKLGRYDIQKSIFDERKSTLKLNVRTKYLKIEVQNRDNQPIDITALKIGTTPLYLYFLPKNDKKYRLYFGNEDATLADYDLKYLIKNFKDAKEFSFSKLHINNLYQPTQKSKPPIWQQYKEILFTIFVLFSIALLAFIAMKLLKNIREN